MAIWPAWWSYTTTMGWHDATSDISSTNFYSTTAKTKASEPVTKKRRDQKNIEALRRLEVKATRRQFRS